MTRKRIERGALKCFPSPAAIPQCPVLLKTVNTKRQAGATRRVVERYTTNGRVPVEDKTDSMPASKTN